MMKHLLLLTICALCSFLGFAQSKNTSTKNRWKWGAAITVVKDEVMSSPGWKLEKSEAIADDKRGDHQVMFSSNDGKMVCAYFFRRGGLVNISYVYPVNSKIESSLLNGTEKIRSMEWIDADNNARITRRFNGENAILKITPNSVVMVPGPLYKWFKGMPREQVDSYMKSKNSWHLEEKTEDMAMYLSQDATLSVTYMLKDQKVDGMIVIFWDSSPSKTSEYLAEIGLSDKNSMTDDENKLFVKYDESDGRATVFVKSLVK